MPYKGMPYKGVGMPQGTIIGLGLGLGVGDIPPIPLIGANNNAPECHLCNGCVSHTFHLYCTMYTAHSQAPPGGIRLSAEPRAGQLRAGDVSGPLSDLVLGERHHTLTSSPHPPCPPCVQEAARCHRGSLYASNSHRSGHASQRLGLGATGAQARV